MVLLPLFKEEEVHATYVFGYSVHKDQCRLSNRCKRGDRSADCIQQSPYCPSEVIKLSNQSYVESIQG